MARAYRSLAVAAARAADDKKAEEVVLLHVARTSPVTDYLLIATALSRAHLESLETAVEEAAERLGLALAHRSQPKSDRWRVLDFGGLIAHLMLADARAFYALDKLHHGSPRIKWEQARAKAASAP